MDCARLSTSNGKGSGRRASKACDEGKHKRSRCKACKIPDKRIKSLNY